MNRYFFIFVKIKRRNCSVAFPLIGHRQVTLSIEKHEQFTPLGREPSKLLALSVNILAVFRKREQEQKAQVIFLSPNGNNALFVD